MTPGAPGANPAGAQAGQPGAGAPKGPELPKIPQTQQPMTPAANTGAGQPLAAAQPASPTAQPAPAPTGATGGGSSSGVAPVSTSGAPSMSAPAAGTPAPASPAPLGPPPTPAPAAPVAQPGAGGPMGPGVAAAASQQQQAAAAAAPIPVTASRAEKDAQAAALRQGLVRRPAGAGDGDIETAVRIAAALHAPPSIPQGAWQFMWAVGVTTEGQIIAANSYGVGFIPDGVNLPSQVVFVSADEAISAGERGRWVKYPFLALQGWAQFHNKTIRVIIGTKDEVEPYKGNMNTRTLVEEDIPPDGTMKGRGRLEVVAPDVAAKLAAWPDTDLHAALPPQPVQLATPDASAGQMLWLNALTPLTQTTGEGYRTAHLSAMATYARHREALGLYEAYTAPFVEAQRKAIAEWLYWGHFAAILTDAGNPELGG